MHVELTISPIMLGALFHIVEHTNQIQIVLPQRTCNTFETSKKVGAAQQQWP